MTALPLPTFLSAKLPLADATDTTSPDKAPLTCAPAVFKVAVALPSYTLSCAVRPVVPVRLAGVTVHCPSAVCTV